MPVSEQRLYQPGRINRWFALASILMTACLFWMIWADYDRPWRDIQDDYFVSKAAFAHLNYLDAMRQERQNEIAEASQRLKDAREFAQVTSASQRGKLTEDLAKADLEFKIANAPYSAASQVLEVTKDEYEKALGAHGENGEPTKRAREKFHAEEKEVEQMRAEKEKWEDERRRIQSALKELDRPVRDAEKRLGDLEAVAENARRKDQEFRGVLTDEGLLGGLPIVKGLINAPLGDFTAKKGTPGRHQVNQIVLPNVRQRLNYLESYTTDRCMTCHVGIDDPDFSQDHLAAKLERSIPGIDEALQRMGKQPLGFPAPPKLPGVEKPLPEGQVSTHWDKLTPAQRDSYFAELLAKVNNYLAASGRKTIALGQPLLAHPDLDLYLDVNSPHPMATMGCTVCHEGNPQETDFVQAAHSPRTHEQQHEWAEKYYIREMGLPNITFETIAHFWDRPMRLPEHTEAGCVKCHSAVTDIAQFESERKGQRINMGQHLFREVGCINCHNEESLAGSRRVGPDLSHVAAKLRPGFVQQWAYFPQSFRPSTRMPHFFLQENNRAESKNQFDPQPELRTQTEVAAMSKYLFAVSKEWKPLAPAEGSVSGDAKRGRDLFRSVGCAACHSNMAEFGEEWITRDLRNREGVKEETVLFRFKAMTQNERVRYAMEHFPDQVDTFIDPGMTQFDPDREYNQPVFSRFAPELSGIGSKVTPEWLYSWLIEPSHYSPETKMPSLRLSPQEAADLVAYLMGLKHDEFRDEEFAMDTSRKELADELMLGLLAAQRSEQRSKAIMRDEGGELTSMLVSFIKNSFANEQERIARAQHKPLAAEQARILGEEQARKLIESMSIEDKKLVFLGNKMVSHYGCYACHTIPGFEETTPPGTDLSTWAEKPVSQLDFAFYDDAFHDLRERKHDIFGFVYPRDSGAKQLNVLSPLPDDAKEQIHHTHAGFATHKLLNPRIWDREKIKRPYDKLKMPNYYFTEDEAGALTTFLLSRVPPRVTDALKVDYDNDALGPIAKGRALTRELNCVGCHQIEDNAPIVQQFFRRKTGDREVFDVTNAPPLLWGEGSKVQHNWLHRFLLHVETLRPWLQIRMPSFYLDVDQATVLTEYFAALSQYDSQTLSKYLVPIGEHIRKPQSSAQTADPAKSAEGEAAHMPGAQWFRDESLERPARNLGNWAIDRKLVRENDLNPLENPPQRLIDAHARVLERTSFLSQLYDVPFPFVEPAGPMMPEKKFKVGGEFLNAMGCLKCHVLGGMEPPPAKNTDQFVQTYRLDAVRGEGDAAIAVINGQPYPIGAEIDGHKLLSAVNVVYETGDIETKATFEGPGPGGSPEKILLQAPSAPNLDLTHERLRRTWVHDWMLDPQAIQPGTKMPQNFPKGVSPFAGHEKYPGTAEDHINLLVDYLYDAGRRGVRAPLQKITATETKGFDEEAKEFEE